jgi:hypothetical protein
MASFVFLLVPGLALRPDALDVLCTNAFYWHGSDPELRYSVSGSLFESCGQFTEGGALSLFRKDAAEPSFVDIRECRFLSCFSSNLGGAIFTLVDDVSVRMCEAINCTANVGSFWQDVVRSRDHWRLVGDEISATGCDSSQEAVIALVAQDSAAQAPFAIPTLPRALRNINCSLTISAGHYTTGIEMYDFPSPTLEFAILRSCYGGPALFSRYAVTPIIHCVSFFNCSTADAPQTPYDGLLCFRNGEYTFERCLFSQNQCPLLVSSGQPTTLTVRLNHCMLDQDGFSGMVKEGVTMIVNDERKLEEPWEEVQLCPTRVFTHIVADYSAPRSLIAIAHFTLLLADALPLSYLP